MSLLRGSLLMSLLREFADEFVEVELLMSLLRESAEFVD